MAVAAMKLPDPGKQGAASFIMVLIAATVARLFFASRSVRVWR